MLFSFLRASSFKGALSAVAFLLNDLQMDLTMQQVTVYVCLTAGNQIWWVGQSKAHAGPCWPGHLLQNHGLSRTHVELTVREQGSRSISVLFVFPCLAPRGHASVLSGARGQSSPPMRLVGSPPSASFTLLISSGVGVGAHARNRTR